MTDKHPLEYVDDIHEQIEELKGIAEFMDDEYIDKALDLFIKCIIKPSVPPGEALPLIVKMQGFASKFKMQATFYMALEPGKAGTDNNKKKNIYFAIAECCDKMAASLKYLSRD